MKETKSQKQKYHSFQKILFSIFLHVHYDNLHRNFGLLSTRQINRRNISFHVTIMNVHHEIGILKN